MQHKIEQRFKRVYNSRAHFHKVSYMFLFFFGSSHFCLHFLLIHLALSPPTLSPFPIPPPTPALFAAICYNILSGCCSIFSLWKHLSKQRVALRVCVAVFLSLSHSLSLPLCSSIFIPTLWVSRSHYHPAHIHRTGFCRNCVWRARRVAIAIVSQFSSVQLSSVRYVQLFNKVFSSVLLFEFFFFLPVLFVFFRFVFAFAVCAATSVEIWERSPHAEWATVSALSVGPGVGAGPGHGPGIVRQL